MGLMFLLVVIGGMGLLAAAYLAVRGAFRNSSYDPEAVRLADEEKLAVREGSDGG